LSKGTGYVSLSALLNWELVRNLIREGYLQQTDIEDILETVEVTNSDYMDLNTFERVIIELTSRFSDDDLDEKDDDDDDDDDDDAFSDDDDVYDENTESLARDLKLVIDRENRENQQKK
jgi:hypothetical protein